MSELIKADKAYYENPAISQSGIKCFIESPVEFYNSFVIRNSEVWDSPTLRFGRLYHTYVLEPEILNQKYTFCKTNLNTNVKKLVDDYVLYKSFDKAFSASEYKESKKESWKEKLENDINIKEYLEFLKTTETRDVIEESDLHRCKAMKDVLLSSKILQNSLFKDDYDIEEFSEYEIFSDVLGVAVKAKIDKIKISHTKKKIIIFDLKTTSAKNQEGFIKSMSDYRYDIQSSFYSYLVKEKFKDLIDKGYTINFVFIPQKSSSPYQFLGLISYYENSNTRLFNELIKPVLLEIKNCYETNKWTEDYRYSSILTQIDNNLIF
jgi:hypothetical protein